MYKRQLDKYKSLPISIKAGLWFTIYGFLQKGISLITVPIFTRIMSPEQYGVFSVYTAWSGIFIIIATMNFHQGVINNAFIRYENERRKVISAFQGLSTVISFALLFIYLLFRDSIDNLIGLPSYILLIMFISFIFRPAQNYWMIFKRYKYEYRLPVIISIFTAIAIPIISFIAIINTTNKGEAKVVVVLAINLIFGLIFYLYNFLKERTFYHKDLWLLALRVNLPLVPHYLSEIILSQSDRIMINKFSGSGDAGIYSIAYSAASIIIILTSSINYSFVPWQYKQLKEKAYDKLIAVSDTVLISVAGILTGLIAFSPEIIKILAPSSYHGAIRVIPAVAAGVFFNYMYQLFARIEIYYEKTKLMMLGSILAAVTNIGLNYIFIPKFGYIAAGYTTLLCYMLLNLFHYYFYKKICKEYIGGSSILNIKHLIYISIGMILVTIIMMMTYDYYLLRYLIILLLIIVFIKFRRKIFDRLRIINK